jgi:ABC-type branched-subunit amino acid transport system substrate-binding protein
MIVCVLFAGCKHKKSSDTIRVGAAIAITGFGSDFGQSENNAIKLLKEKYGKDSKVEFYIEDTKSDVKTGVSAIKKLIDINKCDIVYCELSSIVDATSGIIRDAKVTLIAPVYLENLRDNPFAYRNLPSADQENSALIHFLEENNIVHEKIAVLFSNDVFGQTCFNSFKKLLPDSSTICYSEAVNESALRETAIKAINARPDVIYLGSMSETLGLLIKFLRQNGYDKEIITTDAFSYDYINSLAGEYANGVRYVDFMDSENYVTFRNVYNERFGIKCVPSAMLCYDGISAVISIIKEGKDLEGSSYDGLTGAIVIKNKEIIYPIQVLTWK